MWSTTLAETRLGRVSFADLQRTLQIGENTLANHTRSDPSSVEFGEIRLLYADIRVACRNLFAANYNAPGQRYIALVFTVNQSC